MRKALDFLGQAIFSRGLAVFERISKIIFDYRTRKWPEEFGRRLRDEIAASRCWNCSSSVGQQPLRDPDFPGRYYCSLDCRNTALIKRDSELDEKMGRQPAPLAADEEALLIGKSSPGMYYERGRCVECGHVLHDERAFFSFCSERCEEKAMKPYVTFTGRLVDSEEYQRAVEDRDRFTRNDPGILEEVKQSCGKRTMTDGEIQEHLAQQLKFAELLHSRRKSVDYGEARASFLKKWELQRGYVLEHEKRGETRE